MMLNVILGQGDACGWDTNHIMFSTTTVGTRCYVNPILEVSLFQTDCPKESRGKAT